MALTDAAVTGIGNFHRLDGDDAIAKPFHTPGLGSKNTCSVVNASPTEGYSSNQRRLH